MFEDFTVLRSVVIHEFGDIFYGLLSKDLRQTMDSTWGEMRSAALTYLFHEGEYSGNARFGGHPEESPSELFASAFNLLTNRLEELMVKLQFVEPQHHQLITQLQEIVLRATAPKKSPADTLY